MKRTAKPVFFIVALVILVLAYTSIFGVYTYFGDRRDTVIRGASDIRFGIDIRGGVDVTFGAKDTDIHVTEEQLDGVKAVIEERLVLRNITDYEIYADTANKQVVVRFPWEADESNYDPTKAIGEIGQTAQLAFHIGDATDPETGKPTGDLVLTGNDVQSANAGYDEENQQYVVMLNLKESGKKAFADATQKQYDNNKGPISIWLDDQMISAPAVQAVITNGQATISGSFETMADAQDLANLITSGSLPFELEVKSSGTINPTMGVKALDAMVLAAVIAFVLIAAFMLIYYRVPGFVAVIALLGQVAGSIAAVSGYFGVFNSFTLTLPGIAGIILSIGMGVDANVITAERIKEEIRAGKTIDGAIRSGTKESFWAIFDGNITVIIVAAVLMGVFGPSDSVFGWLLSPVMRWFPVATTGAVYSFGYTLLVGIIFNFVMGMTASRLMLSSLSRLKCLRKPWLYGGER
ncbi:MAG: SecD/SecF family protein translocase subunit [Ruminococcaceae bacterium]|nr:SecD/SecF family protein translocase subunit [Oscillospiraceae bacterium]